MKNLLTILLLLAGTALAAQEKGVTPVATPQSAIHNPQSALRNPQSTYAVVIGISDYQDPGIPDLRFADRDAEAFAAWLSSPAGGALPGASVKTLLNDQATIGKIITALGGLIESCKTGDVAIIYFSGHGDVEQVTKFQRGYWLTYDTPPVVYGAGAFDLRYLQDIITTLSEAGVQVVVVSDACRAGKLAGSEYGGAQATSAALSKQFANEIKILSCQPNEFSLEGEQWGGGRGAFSYHLLDALYGLADQDEDDRVIVKELNRYLEDHVAAETAPHRQNPLVLGDRETRLSAVIPEALAQWRLQKTGDAPALKKIDPRGFEDLMLASADSSIRALYEAFTGALERGDLMPTDSTAGRSANDYYEILIKEPALADLHGLMTRNFAAALMDEGQQVINKFLKTDPQILDNVWANSIRYDHIPAYLHRASELLGSKNYYYKALKAKELFFLQLTIRRSKYPELTYDSLAHIKKSLLYQALTFEQDAPYVLYYLMDYLDDDSLLIVEDRLKTITPKWALLYNSLGLNAARRIQPEGPDDIAFEKPIPYFKQAIAIDPSFTPPYNYLAFTYENMGKPEEAKKWWTMVVERYEIQWKNDSSSFKSFELNSMGLALSKVHRYRDAERVLLSGKIRSNGKLTGILSNLIYLYVNMGKYKEAINMFSEMRNSNEDNFYVNFYHIIGDVQCYYLNDYNNAEKTYLEGISKCEEIGYHYFKMMNQNNLINLYLKTSQPEKAIELLNTKQPKDYYLLSQYLWQFGQKEAAISILDSFLINYQAPQNPWKFSFEKMVALYRLGRADELEQYISGATEKFRGDPMFHFVLACGFAQINRPDSALMQLELAVQHGWKPQDAWVVSVTTQDPLLDPLRQLPEFQAWEKRWSPPYKDYSEN